MDHTPHCRLMLDLMVLAFQTDSTRIGTFMFGNAVSGKNFSFLDGVKGSHHEMSHHENDEGKLDQYERITAGTSSSTPTCSTGCARSARAKAPCSITA
jgi:hypothetical protein